MNIFNNLLINVVILLFPIILNLFYLTYTTNSNKEKSNTFLDFSLLSSLYLFIALNEKNTFLILMNIPLIISYLKKRANISLFMSMIIILTYYNINNYSLLLLLIEYLSYYIIYGLTLKNRKSDNLFLKCFVIFKTVFYIIYIMFEKQFSFIKYINSLLLLILFILILYIIIYMIKKGEDIIKLHMSIKELEKDKQIRTSLFKITHEIKNPIAVCKSYLDMFDFNNEEHQKYIPIVQEEIEKILLLLQDFLSMNKIKINKEILDINLLLEDIINQYELILIDNKIDLITNISEDEIFIEGDYNRLSQVLINIIKNSIEAIDKENSYISINYEIIDNNYKIIIEDNGSGIDDIEKIKEPFYTTKKNGTGLGVSLSYEIIEAHNGTIEYFSEVGKGTKVVIMLPISNLISF